ncbi:MAG TPA: flotillin family protein, partial [Candidatus Dormibacteraeota bacterium]|nr:flotillin family protein [Candidatus Dormibacteraeota bacterium]
MTIWIVLGLVVFALFSIGPLVLGAVLIQERQVGIVVKRFGFKALEPGRLVALNGEAGYQADTLAPGLHFGYWRWQYRILKVPVTIVPQGEIALVLAADGASIPAERIMGRIVDCDNFQDARRFLTQGGEKGRQLGLLTAGTYRLNLALFTVITSATAGEHGMSAAQLMLTRIEPDMVGVATTLDGQPIEAGEIAGPTIAGHNNFQNAQAFLDGGGRRGLQEQILLSGTWNLNPWFVQVEQVAMVQIPIGYVGVVISYVGQAHVDVSGVEFKHGDLVNAGHKGV